MSGFALNDEAVGDDTGGTWADPAKEEEKELDEDGLPVDEELDGDEDEKLVDAEGLF